MTCARKSILAGLALCALSAALSAEPSVKAHWWAGKASSTPRVFLYAQAGQGGDLQLRNLLEPAALALLEWADWEISPGGGFSYEASSAVSAARINEARLGEEGLRALQFRLGGSTAMGGKLYTVSFAESDLAFSDKGPIRQPAVEALALAAAASGLGRGRGRVLDATYKDGVFTYRVAIASRAEKR